MKPYYETELPKWLIPVKRLVLMKGFDCGWLCVLPYPNHPKGCPNFYIKPDCPPFSYSAYSFFGMNEKKQFYLVHSEFNLEAHAAKIKQRHPYWTERQCKNVLYWQGTSRKQLKGRVSEALNILGGEWNVTDCPESMGVNVYVTARLSGLKLERIRYLKMCRHIALLGNTGVERSQLKLF